jgi:acetyltransferase-like isoleucine patch superfamily enzyme
MDDPLQRRPTRGDKAVSEQASYQTHGPGLFELIAAIGVKWQVYPRLFDYPKLPELARRFDQLSFGQKMQYLDNLVRGFRMRRHLAPDSGLPLFTKGTRIRTRNGGRVRLGKFVRLNGTKIFVGSHGNPGDGLLTIGDRTVIAQTKLNVIAPLSVGADCLVAANSIMTTNFHHLDGSYGFKLDAPVTIADHVWICEGAIVLPGTNIGRDTVIGAGAVVSGHIPSNVLVAVSPARVVSQIRGWHA